MTTTTTRMNYYARPATGATTTRGGGIPPRPGLGYLAFPGGRPPVLVAPTVSRGGGDGAGDSVPEPPPQTKPQPKPPSAPNNAQHPRSRSRELEQAEAERGELEWVACGGVLRDGRGNVDVVRTKKVREEVERREKERAMQARWDAYEEAWRGLSAKGKEKEKAERDVVFGDVAWPVWVEEEEEAEKKPTMSISLTGRDLLQMKKRRIIALADITVDRVQDFLLEPLGIRGSTVTPKARIRSSFLRWHPDKLGWLVDRVTDEDVDDVKTGIGIVMECLQRMNEALKPS